MILKNSPNCQVRDLANISHYTIYLVIMFVGLKFWKVGSRKLYAVKESDLKDKKRMSSVINISSSSSDEELITPFAKRKRTTEYVKLSNLSSELRELKIALTKSLRSLTI